MTDQNSPSVTPTPKQLRDAIRDAFTLGWQIVELQSRLQVKVSSSSADSGLRLPGLWHSCFCRIAHITDDAFPDSATANTLYAPPEPVNIPYLYPSLISNPAKVIPEGATAVITAGVPPFDYADVGINVMLGGEVDNKRQPILSDFKLYDVTRRALNCLTLLCTDETDSLIPDSIKTLRSDLMTQLRPLLPQSHQSEDVRGQNFLTDQTVKLLEAWHGYLRQNYYTGGKVPDNNLELVGYEAGHAMSSLSWELLVQTLELEAADADMSRAIEDAWDGTFTDQSIIHLQHQISALSSAMDNAYHQEHPEQKAPDDAATITVVNPDLPSQSIQAVKSSLDYWIAAVKWISQNETHFHSSDERVWRKSLRIALIEQTNVWQTLLSGQESLRGYNVETAAHKIIEDITQEIGNNLRQGFKRAIRQTEDLLQEAKKEANAAIGNIFESGRSACWILLAVGILVAVAGVLALIPNVASGMGKPFGFTGVLSGIGSFLFARYQWLGLSTSRDDATEKIERSIHPAGPTDSSNVLSRLEGAVRDAESTALNAFQRGYEQMRVELDYLNRSIAVTYPLVEFFGKELKLDSNVDFLTDIFWSGTKREEEIKRIIRAAFGGLALMVDPSPPPAA